MNDGWMPGLWRELGAKRVDCYVENGRTTAREPENAGSDRPNTVPDPKTAETEQKVLNVAQKPDSGDRFGAHGAGSDRSTRPICPTEDLEARVAHLEARIENLDAWLRRYASTAGDWK